jgi:UDP-N-acetylmuramoyl-tripeptide--D-alanyl-D-alanine ligase
MRYTIEEICGITGVESEGVSPSLAVEGWSIDSRTIGAGEVYFAILGDVQDGHKFVPEALANGAGAAVVRRDYSLPMEDGSSFQQSRSNWAVTGDRSYIPSGSVPLLRCEDPLEAMHALASHSRNESGLRLIGITGSCGKTTTKDLTAALAGSRLKTSKNKGNLNNIWGLPLGLLRRPAGLDVYVCEMGMSYKGELSRVTRIARPDIAVFTNIHGVHLMNFKSVREIAEAKAEMLEGVPPEGVVVANADDAESMRIARDSGLPMITFALEGAADFMPARIKDRGIGGLSFELRSPKGSFPVASPLPGIHNLQNLLAAFATCAALGLEPEDVLDGLENAEMSPSRTRIVRFADGWTLYDDTYNSNPYALPLTLETVMRSDGFERRIAMLGDMLELGPSEVEEHRKAGRMIAGLGIDLLITLGPLANHMAESALAEGMAKEAVISTQDKGVALEALEAVLRAGDLVLIKGSRGVKMETIVAELTRRHQLKEKRGQG